MAEPDVAHALTRKLGPLPLWQWLVAGVGGVVLAQGLKRATGGSSKTAGASTTTTPTGTLGYGLPPGGGSGAIYAPNNSASAAPPAISDNQQWRVRSEAVLIAKGYTATLVDTALRKYLAGDNLSKSEAAVIELALQLVGIPPENVPLPPPPQPPPVPVPRPTPTPTPTPTPPPAKTSHKALPAGTWKMGYETTVDWLDAPGGGTWYLSNYGGVAAIGAPYKGSAFDLGGGALVGVRNGAPAYGSLSRSGNSYVLHRSDGKSVAGKP